MAVAAALALSALTAGCGSDSKSSGSTASTTARPTSTSAAVSTTVAPAPTAAPVLQTFASPDAAGDALYGAWTTNNKLAATTLAPSAELEKLFAAAPRSDVKNRGCDDGEFGTANCFFGNGQGGVNVTLTPAPAGGWSISSIDPFG